MGDIASGFFAGTGLVDFVLAVTLVEAALLVLWKVRTGRGMPVGDVLAMLLPGMWLMLALRSVISGDDGLITASYLLAAGVSHGGDLLRRHRYHHADKSRFE
ncbi:MAG: hypothetical protein RLZZ20_1500 [Pseudomonadota bacterium]|jgi:hypothetical protein